MRFWLACRPRSSKSFKKRWKRSLLMRECRSEWGRRTRRINLPLDHSITDHWWNICTGRKNPNVCWRRREFLQLYYPARWESLEKDPSYCLYVYVFTLWCSFCYIIITVIYTELVYNIAILPKPWMSKFWKKRGKKTVPFKWLITGCPSWQAFLILFVA